MSAGGKPAAGGGRWIDVAPERVPRWIEGFRERHGDFAVTGTHDALVLRAFDGAVAEFTLPPGAPVSVANLADIDSFVAAATTKRRIGLLLARKASVAVGIATGDDIEVSKVDTSYVQSRTAAGGWSQQRFARRRENQAKAAAGDAADIVLRLLVPAAPRLATVVTGGDRRTVESVLEDRRLAAVSALVAARFLDVAEPRLAVLTQAVAAARAVKIKITDPVGTVS